MIMIQMLIMLIIIIMILSVNGCNDKDNNSNNDNNDNNENNENDDNDNDSSSEAALLARSACAGGPRSARSLGCSSRSRPKISRVALGRYNHPDDVCHAGICRKHIVDQLLANALCQACGRNASTATHAATRKPVLAH